jgi:amino acid transporter
MDASEAARKWYSKGRWALLLAMVGALIVAFVIVTGATCATWLLWIAVPLLMIGLGYIYLRHALPVFLDSGSDHESEVEDRDEPRQS